MSDVEVEIITPPIADETDPLEHGLIALTEAISQVDPDAVAHGFLGGEFGYGARYENEVFAMLPFYWGDCDCGQEAKRDAAEERWNKSNWHAENCYQNILSDRLKAAGASYIDNRQHKFVHVDNGPSFEAVHAIYERTADEYGLSHFGSAHHCTCGHDERWGAYIRDYYHLPTCSLKLPNFRHKASGMEVRWYKWIGRDMDARIPAGVDLNAVFADCLASLSQPSAPGPSN